MPTLETNRLLAAAADACDSKKAEDVRILALDPSESSLTDYFLICSGTNERQNGAIADEIEFRLKTDFGVYANSVEGRRQGEWILLDYVDFVVHIFMPEKRAFYGLERLRKSAKSLTLNDLNDEIKAAITTTRAKTSSRKSRATATANAADEAASDSFNEGLESDGDTTDVIPKAASRTKLGRRASTKISDALTPAKKATRKSTGAKKTVAKKTAGKKAVSKKPQPAAKKGKAKSAAKKPSRRKADSA